MAEASNAGSNADESQSSRLQLGGLRLREIGEIELEIRKGRFSQLWEHSTYCCEKRLYKVAYEARLGKRAQGGVSVVVDG